MRAILGDWWWEEEPSVERDRNFSSTIRADNLIQAIDSTDSMTSNRFKNHLRSYFCSYKM